MLQQVWDHRPPMRRREVPRRGRRRRPGQEELPVLMHLLGVGRSVEASVPPVDQPSGASGERRLTAILHQAQVNPLWPGRSLMS